MKPPKLASLTQSTLQSTSKSSHGAGALALQPNVLSLLIRDIPKEEFEAEALAVKTRKVLQQPVSGSRLIKILNHFGELMKWGGEDTVVDRVAFLNGLYVFIQKHRYAEPVVREALSRVIEAKPWMPAIAIVLQYCETVSTEASQRCWVLEQSIRRREKAVQQKVAEAERDIRRMKEVDSVDSGYDPIAEYRRFCIERRRALITDLRNKVSECEKILPVIEAKLRGTHQDEFFDFWLAEQRSQCAIDRDDIAMYEREITEIETL